MPVCQGQQNSYLLIYRTNAPSLLSNPTQAYVNKTSNVLPFSYLKEKFMAKQH